MPQFFINRPVFAWVIAVFIVLFGMIAIPKLPVARYPSVAPPSVNIYATYPGSTPEMMNNNVVSLIERELSSVKNLLYFESSSDTTGQATITVTFKPGTDPELAQVDVQNRIKIVEPRLPQVVRQNGLNVEASSSGFLMIIGLSSKQGQMSDSDLSDYFSRNMLEELRRVEGVGRVQLFGAEKAMRVWIDPVKLNQYRLTVNDISQAITAENAQISPGRTGDSPAVPGQQVTYPLLVKGQLSSPEEFGNITLRSNRDGSRVVLSDVARLELGPQSYTFSTRENGQISTGAAIQLAPGANAVRTADQIKLRLDDLSKAMPSGMQYTIPFDTTPFVKISIEKVVHTFIEAMVLVFLVMYLFLQNVRYTFIPAIVAPIALLGTFTVMLMSGFSINVLTMFGMVLAIGIIVDDAIVVVENVERIMAEEGLGPKEATQKAMKEITGAVVGITLVLSAVFIPMAMATGSVGTIYRQFTLSMAVSILISAFLALSLTPALCATLLKPIDKNAHEKRGFFGWFNRKFSAMTDRYESGVTRMLKRIGRSLAVYAALCVVLFLSMRSVPSSFLPEEDQGYFLTSIQLPSDATEERTLGVVKTFEDTVLGREGIETNLSIMGFSFSGSGPNSAMAFTTLKDWGERNGATAASESGHVLEVLYGHPEAEIYSLMPPAIDELGNSSGFAMRLEDRAGKGYAALKEAQNKLLELAAGSKVVQGVYVDGLPDGQVINLQIDRQKAFALGVAFDEISQTLSGAVGSLYVNDFPNADRMQQVIIQADAPYRMQPEDILKLYVRNGSGGMVPLSEFVQAKWENSPLQLVRYKGYQAIKITGSAAAGYSSGDAIKEMERLAEQLPEGFAVEWTGLSLQEQQSASEAPMLMVLSMLVVFLVLAALYESWAVPLSVLMVVPLGLLGAVLAVMMRDMSNDVFFKVGMITIIGLSAKNAILIVEFAKQMHEGGKGLLESTIEAARMRLRPILMTSLAFTLGVVPLMIASGASAETQHAIGTGVFGGMVSGTILAIFFVPVFYFAVMKVVEKFTRKA
ncbi:multidrug efflux RND transporter permease subunit [Pectobacterium brasiliense]|uniref:Efflux pump membrane transporter n=1 Tax=Pectobacterium brasiliense TaxID=180957 RepID=A0A3S0ZPR9_9GAMM|nr:MULTISPECIES: efflux RND transporter permease subunit [Pectobacterium]GKW28711.1 multidrug efflux RND transporter permease subunit [Pectobacterium carotovorum subsp. carotovorum]MBN3046273.1 multidrug efflux RND transporter permease subunit [Pectobacterium brasiliense]MBN3076236.1 multidrug efflux RND transporter permease subunit [Pectobacterium brasiliense]MBN3085523.1 multidrug efflux RND transporter permease subunit [Pectobacterium brasiliense]MBN3087775.1 multidrug efflux RND transporte